MSFPRALLVALAAAGGLAIASDAGASVSLAVLFDDLVAESNTVDVVTPTESHSVWENGRIVTYTKVHVDDAVAGSAASGSDVWVQTLGGEVGDVGQMVEGEPNLVVGKPFLVFLRPGPTSGTYWVTARAQGQFVVKREVGGSGTAVLRLQRNAAVGAILAPRTESVSLAQKRAPAFPIAATPAQGALDARVLDDATKDIRAAWTRTHAR